MKKETASAGVLATPFGKFARLQIVTIEDLFAGKKPAMPPEDPAAFKKATREEDKTRLGTLRTKGGLANAWTADRLL
jgi:hypothetical protein